MANFPPMLPEMDDFYAFSASVLYDKRLSFYWEN